MCELTGAPAPTIGIEIKYDLRTDRDHNVLWDTWLDATRLQTGNLSLAVACAHGPLTEWEILPEATSNNVVFVPKGSVLKLAVLDREEEDKGWLRRKLGL